MNAAIRSNTDMSDEPVKVVYPLDLDRMTSWPCSRLDMGCWWVELKDGWTCRRCGKRWGSAPASVVRFQR